MARTRTKGHYIKSYGYSDLETLEQFKKRTANIIKDFCLSKEKTEEFTRRVKAATDFAQVSRVLKEVRECL